MTSYANFGEYCLDKTTKKLGRIIQAFRVFFVYYCKKESVCLVYYLTEQILQLSGEEAHMMMAYLIWNCRPENREYRYNFLYNNCTTMVRDVIERCVRGRVVYPARLPQRTTRDILHEYTQGHPWAAEGDDFLLGSAVDTLASDRAAMFAPEYLMWYADGAVIIGEDGQQRPLVAEKRILTPGRTLPVEAEFPLSPRQVGWGLFALCVLVVLAELMQRRLFTLWSMLLLSAQGLVMLPL